MQSFALCADIHFRYACRAAGRLCLLLAALCLCSCSNNPYSVQDTAGDTLFLSLRDDPNTLDPAVSYTPAIVDNICPAYLQYHYLKRHPFQLEPALGAVMPRREAFRYQAREQGRLVQHLGEIWIFRIKAGLRFQDDACFSGGKGREILASDFLYSFRRMADPGVNSPWLTFFEDKILGFSDYLALNRKRRAQGLQADYARPVAGLEPDAHDAYTFRLRLNQPFPQLRYLMAMRLTSPQPYEATRMYGAEIARHPISCGPYMVAEYKPKQRIVLVRNPNYRQETYPAEGSQEDRQNGLLADAGKTLPRANRIVYTVIREGVTSWNRFLQGYEDIWAVTQTNYQQVINAQGQLTPDMRRHGIRLLRTFTPNTWSFFFNMTDPTWGGYTPAQRKLRQAVSLAIDAPTLIDLFSQGNAAPAQFLIPPDVFGYEASYRSPYCRFDIARAHKLLEEAGYPNGVMPQTGEHLTLYYENSATDAASRQFVALVSRQIEALGIRVVSRSWRQTVMRERLDKGQWQFVIHNWVADYPDPEDFLILLYSPNVRPGPNLAAYHNPDFDRLFERARAIDDGPTRLALLRRLRDIVTEDCPIVFLRHDSTLQLTHSWVHNNKPPNVDMDAKKYLAVDGLLRARLQAGWNRPNYLPIGAFAVLAWAVSMPALRLVRRQRSRRLRRDAKGERQ